MRRREPVRRQRRGYFKIGGTASGPFHYLRHRFELGDTGGKIGFGNGFAVNPEPLPDIQQVRRGIESGFESGGGQGCRQHRPHRPFAVGSRQMDEFEFPVRVAESGQQFGNLIEPEFDPEDFQPDKELPRGGKRHTHYLTIPDQLGIDKFTPLSGSRVAFLVQVSIL